MRKQCLSLVLIGLLLNAAFYSTAGAQISPNTEFAVKRSKAEITELAARGTPIVVKLRDNRKFKGYVGEIRDDNFLLVNYKSRTQTEISYLQVKQAKYAKQYNIPTEKLITSAIVALLVIGVAIGYTREDKH